MKVNAQILQLLVETGVKMVVAEVEARNSAPLVDLSAEAVLSTLTEMRIESADALIAAGEEQG
jgi:hypothetical protein